MPARKGAIPGLNSKDGLFKNFRDNHVHRGQDLLGQAGKLTHVKSAWTNKLT
jgi:hypothetical protein